MDSATINLVKTFVIIPCIIIAFKGITIFLKSEEKKKGEMELYIRGMGNILCFMFTSISVVIAAYLTLSIFL